MRSRLRSRRRVRIRVLAAMAVLPVLGQSTLAETIVDNQDSGFTILGGTWSTETTPVPFGPDFRAHEIGLSTERVRFTPDLPLAGDYQVLLTWPDVPTEDTVAISPTAPFTVNHVGGAAALNVNQQNPPAPDLVVAGTDFELLGVFSFLAGTSGNVELSADAGGRVMADAVVFKLVPEPTTFALGLAGGLVLCVSRRRRRSH